MKELGTMTHGKAEKMRQLSKKSSVERRTSSKRIREEKIMDE
jgi:hypothetical protein